MTVTDRMGGVSPLSVYFLHKAHTQASTLKGQHDLGGIVNQISIMSLKNNLSGKLDCPY